MQTFDQHLLSMLKGGVIGLDEAMTAATNPHDFTVALRQVGLA
jgi:twitching motility protein PilT